MKTKTNTNNSNTLNKLNLAILLALSTSLIGCGGGGGSNPDAPVDEPTENPDLNPTPEPTPEPTEPEALELNSSDALDYGVAFQRALYQFTETLQTYANGDQPQELVRELFFYPQAAKLVNQEFITPSATCESGTATPQMVDVNSDGQVTEDGESMTYSFNQCQITTDSGVMTLNGSMSYAYQATETSTDYQALLSYSSLLVQTPVAAYELNGSRLLNIDTNGGLTLTSTVQADGLTQTASAGDQTSSNSLQANYTQAYQRIGNEWELSISGESTLSQGNQQASLTTTQTEAFSGTVTANVDDEPYQGEYQIRWKSGDSATTDKALQFASVASTQVTEDYQIQIDFLDNADSSTVTESFVVNWAGTDQ